MKKHKNPLKSTKNQLRTKTMVLSCGWKTTSIHWLISLNTHIPAMWIIVLHLYLPCLLCKQLLYYYYTYIERGCKKIYLHVHSLGKCFEVCKCVYHIAFETIFICNPYYLVWVNPNVERFFLLKVHFDVHFTKKSTIF